MTRSGRPGIDATIERRDFLRRAFVAGLVLGCSWSGAAGDEPAGEAVSALAQARAEMARRGAPGVLIVVPKDPANPIDDQLNRLFGGSVWPPFRFNGTGPTPCEPNSELQRLFARAVFVYAGEEEVERELGAKAARAAVVRLDPGWSAAELVARDAEVAKDEVLVPKLVALLDGPGARGLEAAAAHQRSTFTALATHVDGAFVRLDAAEFAVREAASAVLLEACDRLGNALVLAARRTESLEVRTRIEHILAAYVARLGSELANREDLNDLRLGLTIDDTCARLVVPFGVQWELTRMSRGEEGRFSGTLPVRHITLAAGKGK